MQHIATVRQTGTVLTDRAPSSYGELQKSNKGEAPPPAPPHQAIADGEGSQTCCPECGGRDEFPLWVSRLREDWQTTLLGQMESRLCGSDWHRQVFSHKRTKTLMERSGLLEDVRGLTLERVYEMGEGSRAMLAAARSMAEGTIPMLTIWGGPGNGKSLTLRVLVANRLMRGESAIYTKVSKLLDWWREGYRLNEFDKRYAQVAECTLLALDELDKVKVSDWVEEKLFDLIDDRYEGGKRRELFTALAMNKDPEELHSYIVSRLRYDLHGAGGFKIVFNGDADIREGGL